MANKQFCTFRLDGNFFGIDILQVQEILRHLSLTRVPLAPMLIDGLANLRGQIVTVIDMRLRLGLPPRQENSALIHVVVRTEDGATSLLVDEIGDMMELSNECFAPPPEAIQGMARELITGYYQLDHGLLLVLDIAKTVDVDLELFA